MHNKLRKHANRKNVHIAKKTSSIWWHIICKKSNRQIQKHAADCENVTHQLWSSITTDEQPTSITSQSFEPVFKWMFSCVVTFLQSMCCFLFDMCFLGLQYANVQMRHHCTASRITQDVRTWSVHWYSDVLPHQPTCCFYIKGTIKCDAFLLSECIHVPNDYRLSPMSTRWFWYYYY